MDELRGPNIQIILHVKEGLGFGFLRSPFIVSGSLNGYMLETDPAVPTHAPVFDAELVWEADKRRFRSLRVQNVPIKVEVHTMGTQGRKDKVGYLLLSLLGAQPCPSNKVVEVKHSWHRLLGVKSEGKCCHPQLMLSISVEDRVNTPTPRNELRMFHSNEVAYPSPGNLSSAKSILMTLNEYIAESKKTASSPDLQPQLLCDDGLIQVGRGKELFILSFVIGAVENLDLLLPDQAVNKEEEFYITYSVFTHNVTTDRVNATASGAGCSAQFNQRTSLRLASDLAALGRYFGECPHLVTRICTHYDIGICSMDLRKLIPTEDPNHFVENFCNSDHCLTIHERCFILRCDGTADSRDGRRPYVDIEMSLKYVGLKKDVQKPKNLTARSATHLDAGSRNEPATVDCRSESCTQLDQDFAGVAYTNISVTNTARYKKASGDSVLQTNEIADLLKKMCASFTSSQEMLLARTRTYTSDVQTQCGGENGPARGDNTSDGGEDIRGNIEKESDKLGTKLEHSKSDTYIKYPEQNKQCAVNLDYEGVKMVIPAEERGEVMRRVVDELEDWKEKQQELFKVQLKRKEEYHLNLLAKEWAKKQVELELKLRRGVEQCRALAADLSRAAGDFALRGYRHSEREHKLQEAKKSLEAHYTAKYQELREASQKMEADMNHQLKLKDMRIEELETKVEQLEKQIETLKNNAKNTEKEAESKYSGLTKDQTASLIQELRYLEEKLDSAVQSKAFFKEQWGRAVRELHVVKLSTRRQMLTQLQHDRRELGELDVDNTVEDMNRSRVDLDKLKDDFYADILANAPPMDTERVVDSKDIMNPVMSGVDCIGMCDDLTNPPRNPANEKINSLIAQRDRLVEQETPNEELLKHLNREIRNLLLNCSS